MKKNILLFSGVICLTVMLVCPPYAHTANDFLSQQINKQLLEEQMKQGQFHKEKGDSEKSQLIENKEVNETVKSDQKISGESNIISRVVPVSWGLQIPVEYGTIKSRWRSANSSAKSDSTDDTTVIVIQDAHCNFEAQTHIAQILNDIVVQVLPRELEDTSGNNVPSLVVGLEGALGAVDPSYYRTLENKEIRDSICLSFLQQGKISGVEYAAITTPYPITVVGIEDETLYRKHYEAFLSIARSNESLLDEIESIENILIELSVPLYSKELKEFEQAYIGFREDTVSFMDYISLLLSHAEQLGLDIYEYPNIALFREINNEEKNIDFEQLNHELGSFLALLYASLAEEPETLARVKKFTDAYNSGELQDSDFYEYIISLGFKQGLNMVSYVNVYSYGKYIAKFNRINRNELRFERRKLERAIKEALAKKHGTGASDRDAVLELLELSEDLRFAKNLLALKIFNQDMEDLEKKKDSFNSARYKTFIDTYSSQFPVSHAMPFPSGLLDDTIPRVYEFYQYAIKRNRAMVDSMLTTLNNQERNVGVLVAGGFHTNGIVEELKERGVSCVVIAPTITDIQQDQERIYLDRMMGTIDALDQRIVSFFDLDEKYGMPMTSGFLANSFLAGQFTTHLAFMSILSEMPGVEMQQEAMQIRFAILSALDTLYRGKNVPERIRNELESIRGSFRNLTVEQADSNTLRIGFTPEGESTQLFYSIDVRTKFPEGVRVLNVDKHGNIIVQTGDLAEEKPLVELLADMHQVGENDVPNSGTLYVNQELAADAKQADQSPVQWAITFLGTQEAIVAAGQQKGEHIISAIKESDNKETIMEAVTQFIAVLTDADVVKNPELIDTLVRGMRDVLVRIDANVLSDEEKQAILTQVTARAPLNSIAMTVAAPADDIVAAVAQTGKNMMPTLQALFADKKAGSAVSCLFDISLLNEVYAFDSELAKSLLQGLAATAIQLKSFINITPVFTEQPSAELIDMAKKIFNVKEVFSADAIKRDAFPEKLAFVTAPQHDGLLGNVYPFLVNPNVFVPSVEGSMITVLTPDRLLSQVAAIMNDPNILSIENFMKEINFSHFELSSPMLSIVSSDIARKVRQQQVKKAA